MLNLEHGTLNIALTSFLHSSSFDRGDIVVFLGA
jgi:hypothetical protein